MAAARSLWVTWTRRARRATGPARCIRVAKAYTSRLPAVIAQFPIRLDAATRAVAENIAERARDRVPVDSGRLKSAIHVERAGAGEYAVIAGDRDAWYGHFVEFGTVRSAAHPFMTPASEETRPTIRAISQAALKGL
jgi:HK97 gp10 family phage protein